tara:strand:- start:1446 stop:1709 length:264 start_codon:yes stop_codon:yes gene_type:complete
MALKKQSIRKNMTILVDRNVISKDELITMSTLWTESQEKFFRKMLKQGGKFKINGVPFEIQLEHDSKTRSDYTKDSGVIKIPGDGRF